MEILSVEIWKIPINGTLFDRYEYKVLYKDTIFFYKTERVDKVWSYENDEYLPGFYTPRHLELDDAFPIAKRNYLRFKKLQRIINE